MKRLLLFYFLLLLASLWISSCRTMKRSTHRETHHIQSSQSHENTSSTRTQLSEQWFGTASSLEHRDGSIAIDFDGPALISIRPDQTIEASGANPTIRSTVATTRADTAVQLAARSELAAKDTASRAAQRLEASGEVEDSDTSRDTSLTPWIGAGLAAVMITLAILWFFFRSKPSK